MHDSELSDDEALMLSEYDAVLKLGGPAPERIQKVLSAHGVASRREAERMILAGRVTVNGLPAALGQSARFGVDAIEIDGLPLSPKGKMVYIMLNKPRGYVTTMNDERGRKTVLELVADIPSRVYPVGRLDMDSEGLLLLTNDGKFANMVAHPSFNKVKEYEVRVRGDVGGAVPVLSQPMAIDGHMVQVAAVEVVERSGEGGLLRIMVHEGRNRQVRKMCDACGLDIRALRRVSIGALRLGSLKTGHWRHLTDSEVKSLRYP